MKIAHMLAAACAAAVLAAQPSKAFAQQPSMSPEAQTAIAAITRFTLGYGVWLWENKCQKLAPDARAGYEAMITKQMQRLSQAVDIKLFNAAMATGQSTANDSKTAPACGDADALDFANFGIDMAKETDAKLAALPPGYHLSIAN